MIPRIVTFEVAKLAKKLGYAEGSHDFYEFEVLQHNDRFIETNSLESDVITEAPLQSVLQEWLRNKYKIFVLINYNDNHGLFLYYTIYIEVDELCINCFKLKQNGRFFGENAYEKALELGLLEALKYIK